MQVESKLLKLCQALIARPSLTPKDEGCQELIGTHLSRLGFQVQSLRFQDVDNLWAIRGNQSPLFVFAGHTDVVPVGNHNDWVFPPFAGTVSNGMLYGRGAADMKGSIAAMMTALEHFIEEHPDHKGSIAFLITSDEEGPAENGTVKVVEYLKTNQIHIDYCLVGEPSSHGTLGDTLKIGRRGSMTGLLKIRGKQGHIAYPEKAENPIHRVLEALLELTNTVWGPKSPDFPPTSFQISNLNAGTGAGNVIPGSLDCLFNFRFSTEVEPLYLQKRVRDILDKHHLNYELTWKIFGHPFLTKQGKLLNACFDAISEINGIHPTLSTTGGTSDGRFIAGPNTEVIELGPCNETIHSVNECVRLSDLEDLSRIYQSILYKLLVSDHVIPNIHR